MPRTAASSAGVPTGARTRLHPPDDLTGPEREVFLSVVLACRADHFQEQERDLLCIYVRAVVREKVASGEIAAGGYVTSDGKPSVYHGILKNAVRDVTVTSRLLRLNPVARAQSSAAEPEKVSYYERMSLEARRDEPN
jgi:hypothetical protein